MSVLKSKAPYLILLVIFFCIAATDSLVWSEKVDPMVIEVKTSEESRPPTPNSFANIEIYNKDK